MRFLPLMAIILSFLAAPAAATNPWLPPASLPSAEVAKVVAPHKGSETATANGYQDITKTMLEEQLATLLKQAGAGELIEVDIIGHPRGSLVTSRVANLDYQIDDLQFSAEGQNWQATLYPQKQSKPLPPIALEGRFEEQVLVPVFSQRVKRGTVVSAADIDWKPINASRLSADTIRDESVLIGKTPLRSISAERVIRQSEMISPPVITKNSQITVHYRSGGLEIHTIGIALEDGAEKDIIRVRNADSKQVMQARVIREGVAEIASFGILAAKEE